VAADDAPWLAMEPMQQRGRRMSVSNGIVRRAIGSLALAAAFAACGGAAAPTSSPTPAPTERATPTPVAGPVGTAREAAALVLATNPLFADARELDPNLIGQSAWWASRPLEGGGYEIEVTVGWGDCPAGCINRHVWTFEVKPDGAVALVGETGDAVPGVLPG
jgi:hypothetical protein